MKTSLLASPLRCLTIVVKVRCDGSPPSVKMIVHVSDPVFNQDFTLRAPTEHLNIFHLMCLGETTMDRLGRGKPSWPIRNHVGECVGLHRGLQVISGVLNSLWASQLGQCLRWLKGETSG